MIVQKLVSRECEKLQSECERLKTEKASNTKRREEINNELTKVNQEICKQVNWQYCNGPKCKAFIPWQSPILSLSRNLPLTVTLTLTLCLTRKHTGTTYSSLDAKPSGKVRTAHQSAPLQASSTECKPIPWTLPCHWPASHPAQWHARVNRTVCGYSLQVYSQPCQVSWSECRQLLAAVLYSSDEPRWTLAMTLSWSQHHQHCP